MIRSAARYCDAGCGRMRERWMTVCRHCWRRLPNDLSGAILIAKRQKAPHRRAAAEMAALAWLKANPPADGADLAARICGEAPP